MSHCKKESRFNVEPEKFTGKIQQQTIASENCCKKRNLRSLVTVMFLLIIITM